MPCPRPVRRIATGANMTDIAIIVHSGYGHTRRQAEFVQTGVTKTGATAHFLTIDEHGDLPEAGWEALAKADGIIFGSPTYMGGPSWQFKKFADASSKPWFGQAWKDKFAGGFTNSASLNGDKQNTLLYFVTLAMQHGMAWVGLGMLPASTKAADRNDPNRLGGSIGAISQSPADAGVDEMFLGDLQTAETYGERFANFVAAHKK
jgi:multimeric flavodoxin WrbA